MRRRAGGRNLELRTENSESGYVEVALDLWEGRDYLNQKYEGQSKKLEVQNEKL